MTKEDFEILLRNQSFDIVVWNKHHAYNPSGYGDNFISLQSVPNHYGDYDYQTINEENYHYYEVRLTGEMKAILYMTHKQLKEAFQHIGRSFV